MIDRPWFKNRITNALRRSRAVAILGARQCGKSTLARQISADPQATYFDLEDPEHAARLSNPKLALARCKGLVVIDEAQRRPEVYPVLRVLLDREPLPAKFLLLGSASPALTQGLSDSLAGRVEYVALTGFQPDELPAEERDLLWERGGFPRSFLATTDADSIAWRRSFVQSMAERDLRLLGVDLPPDTVRRFLSMVAHCHGQTWNSSAIAGSMQVAHTTTRRYLDLLTGAYLIRQLPAWFENVGKRQVKAPKAYIRDSGLLHALLGVQTIGELAGHPKLGASWEGFVVETLLSRCPEADAYFWGTHAGAELDLLLVRGERRLGFEIRYTESPHTTKAMHVALETLKLEALYVVYPGQHQFPLTERCEAISLGGAVAVAQSLASPRPGGISTPHRRDRLAPSDRLRS